VPVKLLSFNTILMCGYLMASDATRLLNFFFRNRAVPGSAIALPYSNRKLRYALLALKGVFILFIAGTIFSDALDYQKIYGDNAPKPPLHGIYYTETFIRNHDTSAALQSDTTRWKRLIVNSGSLAYIQKMNDTSRSYNFKIDTLTKTAVLYPNWDTLHKSSLHYTKDTGYLTLTGKINNDSLYIRLKRFDTNRFRLVNRGFHWVNEYPFNR